MKKWKCTVCGYIHTGEEPPDKCPVCGADQSKFIALTEETAGPAPAAPVEEKPKTRSQRIYARTVSLILKYHAHPVSVHVPNGVLPMVVIFFLIAALLHVSSLDVAALVSLIYVVLAMPVVLFSGYVEWKNRYGGNLTVFFITKIMCAALVATLAFALTVWRLVDPCVLWPDSPHRWLFILFGLLMLAAAGVAGFLGGKLVFKD